MPASTPRPKRLSTRLLYPFHFDCSPSLTKADYSARTPTGIAQLTAALCAHRLRIGSNSLAVWECCRLRGERCEEAGSESNTRWVKELYTQGFLPPVRQFLFAGQGKYGGRYLRMPAKTRAALFQGRISVWPCGRERWCESQRAGSATQSDQRAPLFIDRITELELFVNGLGVGVLSLSFELEDRDAAPLDLTAIRTLLYHLSHRLSYRGTTLSRYHEADEPERWQRIPERHRSRIASAPSTDTDWRDRLGRKGGDFALDKLFRALLYPIRSATGLRFSDSHQPQFLHYSVVQFDASVKFTSERPHPPLSGELAALTQFEEIGHAGSTPGQIPVAWCCLDCCHVATAASQGSVHFIADQPKDAPGSRFNTARLGVVRDKYFIDFLLAFLQDQYLKKAAARCARLVTVSTDLSDLTTGRDFTALRHEVLAFDALCRFTHINSRHAHMRYYRLAQEGLSVREAMTGVYGQLADLDALCKFHQQSAQRNKLVDINRELSKSVQRQEAHQQALVSMQNKIEWVELFLVGVYSVYLTNYLGENFGFDYTYVGWAILAIAATAAVLAAWLLQPWRHAAETGPRATVGEKTTCTGKCGRWLRKWGVPVLIILILAIYLGVGFAFFHHPKPGSSSGDSGSDGSHTVRIN